MAKIAEHLPIDYDNSRYFKNMGAAGDEEFKRLNARIEQAENNMAVDTADEDGLRAFERDFRLNRSNDTDEVRKGQIKAKKRGSQPTTEENLRNAIRIFDPAADVEQHTEDYSFVVNMQAPEMLIAAMQLTEDIKPAHLGVDYSVKPETTPNTLFYDTITSIHGHIPMPARRYRTYDDIKDMTYEELRGKTYEQILYKE